MTRPASQGSRAERPAIDRLLAGEEVRVRNERRAERLFESLDARGIEYRVERGIGGYHVRACDCEAPEVEPALVSNGCPIHNTPEPPAARVEGA